MSVQSVLFVHQTAHISILIYCLLYEISFIINSVYFVQMGLSKWRYHAFDGCTANTNHQFALPRHGLKAGEASTVLGKMSPIPSAISKWQIGLGQR